MNGATARSLRRAVTAALLFAAVIFSASLRAQSVASSAEAIARARVSTRILYVTAHPDDESSSILTYLARGLGADVALCSTTRGEGGQNASGPEQGAALAILRSVELERATRGYGVGLYFANAPDFGYSKSAEETLRIWGDTGLEGLVQVIRTFRPDIVINQWGGVHSGHGQHQATGIITPQAIEAAADPKMFPQQLANGLSTWRVAMLLGTSRSDTPPADAWRVPVETISPLWGKSYMEMGREAFANHVSQGILEFLDSPFFRRPIYLAPAAGTKLDAAVLAGGLPAIAGRFPGHSDEVRAALTAADAHLAEAQQSALALRWANTVQELAQAAGSLVSLSQQFCAAGQSAPPAGCMDLAGQRRKIDAAIVDAAALHLEARAARNEVVAGEKLTAHLNWDFREGVPVKVTGATVIAPAGWSVEKQKSDDKKPSEANVEIAIPGDASTSAAPADSILPEPPPLLSGSVNVEAAGYAFSYEQPLEAARNTAARADLLPVTLVPAVTLTLEPRQVMLPARKLAGVAAQAELLARIRYHGLAAATVVAGLGAPAGWRVAALEPLHFSAPGEQLVRFELTIPSSAAEGDFPLSPFAKIGDAVFRSSLEALPSLPTRSVSEPAEATVHILNLAVPAHLHIGYITAENDPLPDALRQIGIQTDLLDDAQIAFGDLRRFDAIVIGIRGYELRDELGRSNQRLLEYVKGGGTLVVQYQRDYIWNKLAPAPFPATMPDQTSRTTDENSPVKFLEPSSPLLNFPNRITLGDFKGWVQERGLYYWGNFDPRYHAVLGMQDPGEEETKGALVYARDGKGVYIYTGIAFFRQLPEGEPGAYRLFVNLLSQSRTTTPAKAN